MAGSNDNIITYVASGAIPAFYVVNLEATLTNGCPVVTKCNYADTNIIGVTVGEAADGELVGVIPLGRGGITKIAVEKSEAITVGDIVRLSETEDGTVDNNGNIAIGYALNTVTSAAGTNAIAEVVTCFPLDLSGS